MKYKNLTALLLVSATLITGCASTGSSGPANDGLQVAENESAIQTTIVAQRLSQWPYEKSKLTYVLVNKDIINISQDVSQWKNIVEDAITEKLASKGLTKVASNGALTVQYGVMVKSDDKKNRSHLGETSDYVNRIYYFFFM